MLYTFGKVERSLLQKKKKRFQASIHYNTARRRGRNYGLRCYMSYLLLF